MPISTSHHNAHLVTKSYDSVERENSDIFRGKFQCCLCLAPRDISSGQQLSGSRRDVHFRCDSHLLLLAAIVEDGEILTAESLNVNGLAI